MYAFISGISKLALMYNNGYFTVLSTSCEIGVGIVKVEATDAVPLPLERARSTREYSLCCQKNIGRR